MRVNLYFFLILISFISVLQLSTARDVNCVVPFQMFTQMLDHFNANDERTFQQAYLLSDANYQPGGPIMFLAGFEAGLSQYELCANTVYSPLGTNLNALAVCCEVIY